MALMEISIVPLGTGNTSLSDHISQVIKIIQHSEMPYELNDMGTTVQGNTKELLNLAAEIHESVFSYSIKRVYTVIKIDDRRDKDSFLGAKMASVRSKI